jgi:hypothetical protein
MKDGACPRFFTVHPPSSHMCIAACRPPFLHCCFAGMSVQQLSPFARLYQTVIDLVTGCSPNEHVDVQLSACEWLKRVHLRVVPSTHRLCPALASPSPVPSPPPLLLLLLLLPRSPLTLLQLNAERCCGSSAVPCPVSSNHHNRCHRWHQSYKP